MRLPVRSFTAASHEPEREQLNPADEIIRPPKTQIRLLAIACLWASYRRRSAMYGKYLAKLKRN
jgi:hypothetical protein